MAREWEWRHAQETWAEDFDIWKKSVSWVLASEEDGWLSGLAEIRPVVCSGVPHLMGGADGKVSIERLCLPLLMSKNLLNSKAIKSFVPELRSRKHFLCFGIPMLSMYVRYEHSMSISHIHVWLCDKTRRNDKASFSITGLALMTRIAD